MTGPNAKFSRRAAWSTEKPRLEMALTHQGNRGKKTMLFCVAPLER